METRSGLKSIIVEEDRSGCKATHSVLHRNPENHVFFSGRRLLSLRGKGNIGLCAKWYSELGEVVQKNLKLTGFEDFVKILSLGAPDETIIQALGERWWDTTHTFHFDNVGELTMTPIDFSAMTGLPVGGKTLQYGDQLHADGNKIEKLFGLQLRVLVEGGETISAGALYDEYYNFSTNGKLEVDQLTRVFILALVGAVLCTDDERGTLNISIIGCLENIDEIRLYNWGGAGLGSMYRNMNCVSRGQKTSGCIWKLWEVWASAYIKPLTNVTVEDRGGWPQATAWIGLGSRKVVSPVPISKYRDVLRHLLPDEVVFNPWGVGTVVVPDYLEGSIAASGHRILLHTPSKLYWYLGERVTRQSMQHHEPQVPQDPPTKMVVVCHSKIEEDQHMMECPADSLLLGKEVSYTEFVNSVVKYSWYPQNTNEECCREDVIDLSTIPWSLSLAALSDDCTHDIVQIPRDKSSVYISVNTSGVSVNTAKELICYIAGLTAVLKSRSLQDRDAWVKVKRDADRLRDENVSLREELAAKKGEIVSLMKCVNEEPAEDSWNNCDEITHAHNKIPVNVNKGIFAGMGNVYRDSDDEATVGIGETSKSDGDDDWTPTAPSSWRARESNYKTAFDKKRCRIAKDS